MDEKTSNIDSGIDITTLTEQLAPVRDMFAAIVVCERYTIEDINGNAYEFKPVLSARRQISAALYLEKLVRKVQVNGAPNMNDDGARTMMNLLTRNLHDDEFVSLLDDVWASIHPEIAAASRAAALDGELITVIDLFSLEAIVEGLLPFFARFGTSLIGMMGRATGAESKKGPSSFPANRPPHSES